MKKLNFKAFIILSALFLASCSNRSIDSAITKSVSQERAHQWYYFTKNGFFYVDLPQNAPKTGDIPWTEAVRISSAGSNFSSDETEEDSFALVNRLGLLSFTNGRPKLYTDESIFSSETASMLFFEKTTPFFTLFKDRTFNTNDSELKDLKSTTSEAKNSESMEKALRPFIVRFQAGPGIFIPIYNYEDFDLDSKSEITDLTITTDSETEIRKFICSVKTYEKEKNEFTYFAWSPAQSLDEITNKTASSSLQMTEMYTDEYRKALAPASFSKAPERLRNLLAGIPKSYNFSIKCRSAKQNSDTYYFHGNNSLNAQTARAILAPNYTLAVFNDGTTYLSGSLNKRAIINEGETVAFRLPKLPAGYIYTDAMISQGTLIVAWEEVDFYVSGRTGFITIDLDKVFYL